MAEGDSGFVVQTKRRRRASLGQKYRKKSGVFATPVTFKVDQARNTRESVLQAAAVFMMKARANAAKFSTRIPPATTVQGYDEQKAMVVTDGAAAPNAAPFEFRERHPVFADKDLPRDEWTWRYQPRRSYMGNAATNKPTVSKAVDVYGDIETKLLAEERKYNE